MKGEKVFVYCALTLSVFISLSSGQSTSPAPPTTVTPTTGATTAKPTGPTPVDPNTLKCIVYNLTLKLTNVTYDDSLANPHSAQFVKLRMDFEVGILQVYDGYAPFVGVTTLRFSKTPDGKSMVHFAVEFNTNGTHLPNLTKAIALGKLGKLTPVQVAPKLDQAACYKEPAPPVCPIPCPSACAPTCGDPCCQMGYQQTYYIPPPPPVPVPTTCPNSCPSSCAAVGCTPACCNTLYNQAPYNYGKRHHAPRPVTGAKKHRIFYKHHRKN